MLFCVRECKGNCSLAPKEQHDLSNIYIYITFSKCVNFPGRLVTLIKVDASTSKKLLAPNCCYLTTHTLNAHALVRLFRAHLPRPQRPLAPRSSTMPPPQPCRSHRCATLLYTLYPSPVDNSYPSPAEATGVVFLPCTALHFVP